MPVEEIGEFSFGKGAFAQHIVQTKKKQKPYIQQNLSYVFSVHSQLTTISTLQESQEKPLIKQFLI